MHGPRTNFWPTARHYAEAVQCPAVCFEEPSLKRMLPAVDRLGMPLVTSGQFAYVFKLNAEGTGEAVAVRCFRGYLGDREARYRALDAHLAAHRIAALPRFRYLPEGVLVAGRRYPALVMEWVEGPTLDVYLDEAVGRREALLHLAGEWARLVGALREAGVAHGDLQHGNIIVERGRLRLVDLDGMYVPALEGFRASEVGHQHYQHPRRDVTHFSRDTDNFSALVVYLSLVSLAERPELWREHHDENLLFTRADFLDPATSALFAKIEALGGEPARLAGVLKGAAASPDPSAAPCLTELVSAPSKLPSWMTAPADIEVGGRTREVARASVPWPGGEGSRPPKPRPVPTTPASASVQGIFNTPPAAAAAPLAPRDPSDVLGNGLRYAGELVGNTFAYVWWLPLHNIFLENLWELIGVTSVMSGTLLTLAVLAPFFILYGFARAYFEASGARTAAAGATAPRTPPLAAAAAHPPTLHGAAPGAPLSLGLRPVVGNRGLGIYHLPDCEWVARTTNRQRVDFDSPASAQAASYRPCRVCSP